MKRQIRRSVFETNSSSMHSLTIRNGHTNKSDLRVGDDNKVEIDFGEFGWEICDYSDQYTKLQYILTMCACTEGSSCITPEKFYETDGFKSISNAIARHCDCDGIRIKDDCLRTGHWDYSNEDYLDFDGYIDHQSCEDYSSVSDYLEQHNISSVEAFIFNDGIIVHTDNDNH